MPHRTGVLCLTFQRRAGDGWPVVAEFKQEGELPLRRDGVLKVDLTDLAARGADHGRVLGDALFAGPVGEAWALARGRCPDRLHVALHLEDPELRGLKWELLEGPLDGRSVQLRLDQRTPLALEVPSESERSFPSLRAGDLRALVLVTSPSDLGDYGLAHFDTLAALQCAREAIAPIPCDVLAFGVPDAAGPPTLESLCARLTARPYAILHLVCHGAYGRGRNEAVLYLADDDETTAPVPADKLLRRLGRLGGEVGLPHLAFLCACESAAPEAERALGGLGGRLVRELGLPAVVAMTDRISVDTASALVAPFYRQLGAHGLPDLALAEASTQIAERRDVAAALAFVRAAGVPLLEKTGPEGQAPRPPPVEAPAPIFAASWLPLSLGARFLGREGDLAALRRLLVPETGPRADAVALIGPAGFGKTRLALEFVWRHRASFPGGIFWLSAAAAERCDATLHHLLTLLDPGAPPLDVLRARGERPGPHLAAAIRAHRPGRARLWVIEDIPDPAPGAAFDLQAWCPAWGEVAVLAISRARLLDPAIVHHELVSLDTDAGAALLQATAGAPLDPALARRISEWVGGLPLALELLGKSLGLGDLGPDDLRELIDRGSVAQTLGEAEEVVAGAGAGSFGLFATLHASYESLTPAAQRLARLLAQLGPEPLPTALVKAFGADAGRPARAALVARSFVTGLSGQVFGTMHRVLADYLRGLCRESESARAREVLLAGLPMDALDRPERWPELSAWAVHAEALLARAAGGEEDLDLALVVGRLYLNQDRLDEAFRVQTHAVALARRALPPEHPLALLCHLLLGSTLRSRGDHEGARKLQEQALAAAMHHHGELHLVTDSASLALAHTLRETGDRGRSRRMYESLLTRWRRYFGPDDDRTTTIEIGLAATLLADGDLSPARELVDSLLPRLTARDGPDGLSVVVASTLRADVLFRLGRVAEALSGLEEALATATRLLGPDHAVTLVAADSLALVLQAAGELTRAHELARDVHARTERHHGPDHPDTLLAVGRLATLTGQLGDWPHAHDLLRMSSETARARLGPRHPIALTLRHMLGTAAFELGDLRGAGDALREVVDLLAATAGPEHPRTLAAQVNLADVQVAAGEPAKARDRLAALEAAAARRLGPDHPEVLSLRNSLALAVLAAGDPAAAAVALEDLVARSRAVLGDSHIFTLQRTAAWSRARLDAGDPAGARAVADTNLAALERLLGGAHPDALRQRVVRAAALRQLGLSGAAEADARVARDGLQARLPADHGAVLDATVLLALTISDQDRVDEAYPLMAGAEPLYARRFGEEHPTTASLRFDLAAIELRQSRFEAAAARLAAALPGFYRVWGEGSPYTLLAEHNLALAEAKLGRLPEGLARLRALVPRARAALGDHPIVAGLAQNLAALEARAQKT